MQFAANFFFIIACPCLISLALPAEERNFLEIEKLGGSVSKTHRNSNDLEIDFHLRGKDLSDQDLEKLKGIKNLVSLNLGGTKVTAKGLAHLKEFASLRRLHLEKTLVSDDGMVWLKNLKSLEYLNLYSTKISDAGLSHLKDMGNLRRLYLWQTKTTKKGVETLCRNLPNLLVDTGADLSVLTPSEPPKKLGNLKWRPATTASLPKSKSGPNLTLLFENKSKKKIKLYWISYGGQKRLYGEIEPGKTRRQNTYTSNTWLVCDQEDSPLGHFISERGDAKAIIPAGI